MEEKIKATTNELIKKYKELDEYEKKGISPGTKFINSIYALVFNLADMWEYENQILYDLHSSLIEKSIDESFNCIKNAQESEFFNLFNKEINRIKYIIFHLNRGFIYLDRFHLIARTLGSLNIKSFNMFKNNFLIPCKDNLFKSLMNYLKDNHNGEKSNEIKNIFKLMNVETFSNPKIIKINNEITWENEGKNLQQNENGMFDNWFNNYFLKDISSYYNKKSIEFKNLSITELISSILNVKFQPNSLKNYFDEVYYNKISLAFNESLIKNNKEIIENYFFNLDKNGFKQFYEINKNYKSCLNLICTFLIYSIESNGLKIFENKGIQFNLKEENICIPIEIKKGLDKFFSEFFNKSEPEYNNSLIRICQKVLNMKSYSKKLALYVNDCMRKNFKGKSEEEKKMN